MRKVKAIFFDMDGVLWASNECHEMAFKTVFKEIGCDLGFFYQDWAGMRTDKVFEEILSSSHLSDKRIEDLVSRKRFLAQQYLKKNPPLQDNLKDHIKRLSSSFRLHLVSSSSQNNVQLFLNASGCLSYFLDVLSGDQVEEAKPSPAIYLRSLANGGLGCDEVVVVEDSRNGIQSAINAGIKQVIGFQGTLTTENLLKNGVVKVIENIGEIEEYLLG